MIVAVTVAMLAACGKTDPHVATAAEALVRVNGQEITLGQLQNEFTATGAAAMATATVPNREVLDKLIDEELLVHAGLEEKLDRDPQVLQALEKARRQIIAQRVQDKLAESVAQPSVSQVRDFYEANPALFARRRIYIFNQFVIARAAFNTSLQTKLDYARTRDDVIAALKAQRISFNDTVLVRPAEQLPMPALPFLTVISRGKVMVFNDQGQTNILQLIDFVEQPTNLQQAAPLIREYLINSKKKELIADQLKELRAAGTIEYLRPLTEATSQTAGTEDKLQSVEPPPALVPVQQPRETVHARRATSAGGSKATEPVRTKEKPQGAMQTADGGTSKYGGKNLADRQN